MEVIVSGPAPIGESPVCCAAAPPRVPAHGAFLHNQPRMATLPYIPFGSAVTQKSTSSFCASNQQQQHSQLCIIAPPSAQAAPTTLPAIPPAIVDRRAEYAKDLSSFMWNLLLEIHYPMLSAAECARVQAAEHQRLTDCHTDLHCLFAVCAPAVSLEDYMHRLTKYMRCSPECFLIAARYVARLGAVGVPVTPRTVHRLYLASLVLAAKMRDDKYYTISYYAQVGGVQPSDLRIMEKQVFTLLSYDCSCGVAEYTAALQAVRAHRASCHNLSPSASFASLPATPQLAASPTAGAGAHSLAYRTFCSSGELMMMESSSCGTSAAGLSLLTSPAESRLASPSSLIVAPPCVWEDFLPSCSA